jgi:predicted CopG family antitoxin
MAVKTITIDLEAYEALARHKRKGDSFSRVIKEHFGRRRTGRDLSALVKQIRYRKTPWQRLRKRCGNGVATGLGPRRVIHLALRDARDFSRVPDLVVLGY